MLRLNRIGGREMGTEHWWNDTGWEKGCPRKHPSVPFFHHKSRTHLFGIEHEWPTTDDQNHETAEKNLKYKI